MGIYPVIPFSSPNLILPTECIPFLSIPSVWETYVHYLYYLQGMSESCSLPDPPLLMTAPSRRALSAKDINSISQANQQSRQPIFCFGLQSYKAL